MNKIETILNVTHTIVYIINPPKISQSKIISQQTKSETNTNSKSKITVQKG